MEAISDQLSKLLLDAEESDIYLTDVDNSSKEVESVGLCDESVESVTGKEAVERDGSENRECSSVSNAEAESRSVYKSLLENGIENNIVPSSLSNERSVICHSNMYRNMYSYMLSAESIQEEHESDLLCDSSTYANCNEGTSNELSEMKPDLDASKSEREQIIEAYQSLSYGPNPEEILDARPYQHIFSSKDFLEELRTNEIVSKKSYERDSNISPNRGTMYGITAVDGECSFKSTDNVYDPHNSFSRMTYQVNESGFSKEFAESVKGELYDMREHMRRYEIKVTQQNRRICEMEENLKFKDNEIEKFQNRNFDVNFLKTKLKDKEREILSLKQELNRNNSIVYDLQANVKQIRNQMKTMSEQTFETEDRVTDIERLSPMMGVFEWRIDNYKYHSMNSEYLCSNEFYTHLNGYCCFLSCQWFGNKNGRLGVYLHLNAKRNLHLVENCKIRMVIQCVGSYGLMKEHLVDYDASDIADDNKHPFIDCISGDDFFLLKPYLDKYLIEDSLYIYCHLIPDLDYY